ncbi:MAG: hypothetical protein P4L59_04290 [Desulfosporosinus sp.]|nr:hypothetical protein [Desulfosporosinus sp.]
MINYSLWNSSEVKYDGEWVYLIDCKENQDGTITGGEVVLHSPNRDYLIRNIRKYEDILTLTSLRYAGKIPEGISVVL